MASSSQQLLLVGNLSLQPYTCIGSRIYGSLFGTLFSFALTGRRLLRLVWGSRRNSMSRDPGEVELSQLGN